MIIQRGTQIAYIPMHAEGDIEHPDVEFGFVTSVVGDMAFCRYWHKGHIGRLRTLANSEGTYLDDLRPHVTVSLIRIDTMLEQM